MASMDHLQALVRDLHGDNLEAAIAAHLELKSLSIGHVFPSDNWTRV